MGDDEEVVIEHYVHNSSPKAAGCCVVVTVIILLILIFGGGYCGYRRYRHSDGYSSSYSSPAVIHDDPYVPPTVTRTVIRQPASIYRDPFVPVFKTKTVVRRPNPYKRVVDIRPPKRTDVFRHKGKRPKTRVTLPKTKIVRRPKGSKRSKAGGRKRRK